MPEDQPSTLPPEVPTSWDESETVSRPQTSRGSFRGVKIAIGMFIFLAIVGVGVFVYFRYVSQTNLRSNIEVTFSAANQVFAGQPFTLSVTATNISEEVMKNVRLSLLLPDGMYFVGQPPHQRLLLRSLDEMVPGSAPAETFDLIATADSQSNVKRVQAKVVYATLTRPEVDIEYDFNHDIAVPQAALALAFGAPRTVYAGQDFDLDVTYQNNTKQDFRNVTLSLEYPPEFRFKESTPASEEDQPHLWKLGNVAAGENSRVAIKGSLNGPQNSFYNFKGTLSADFAGQTYVLNVQNPAVSIAPSPLSLSIALEGTSQRSVVQLGERITYVLRYRNNSDVTLNEVRISATPKGKLFNLSQAVTEGSFDSVNNVFTWTAGDIPQLRALAPQQEGTVRVSLPLLREFPIRTASDKHYTVFLEGTIESSSVPSGTAAQRTFTISSVETKVAGKIAIDAQAYWRDAASGIVNTGSFPMKVNKPVQFTIHWKITDHANDVKSVRVTGTLQSGSKSTGVIKSNISTKPIINANTGQITWDIPKLPANVGVVAPAVEAIFQIELTPAVNQIGSIIEFMSDTALSGIDEFTNLAVKASDRRLDSTLPDDKTVVSVDKTVQQ